MEDVLTWSAGLSTKGEKHKKIRVRYQPKQKPIEVLPTIATNWTPLYKLRRVVQESSTEEKRVSVYVGLAHAQLKKIKEYHMKGVKEGILTGKGDIFSPDLHKRTFGRKNAENPHKYGKMGSLMLE